MESERYGIWSIEFLEEEFENHLFWNEINIHSNDSLNYDQGTQIQKKGNRNLVTIPKDLTVQSNILIDVN